MTRKSFSSSPLSVSTRRPPSRTCCTLPWCQRTSCRAKKSASGTRRSPPLRLPEGSQIRLGRYTSSCRGEITVTGSATPAARRPRTVERAAKPLPRMTIFITGSRPGLEALVAHQHPALAIAYLDVDLDALAHALGHHAEILELGQCPLQALVVGVAAGQVQGGLGRSDPPAALFVAGRYRADLGADRLRRILELAQGEQQARRQAVGDRCQQQPGGIGSGDVAQRRRFVGQQRLQPGVREVDPEGILAILFQADADGTFDAHGSVTSGCGGLRMISA